MRARRLLTGGAAALGLLAFAGAGCDSGSKKGGGSSTGGGAPATVETGLGTPNPPFQGDVPKGAMKVEGYEVGRYGGTLVVAVPGDPKSFNPILANESSTTDLLFGPVYETCIDFDRDKQEDEWSLCEGFDRSEDGLTYTFKLREGLLWSDGAPMTADDFEFSYQVLTDPNITCSLKDLFRQGKDADGKDRFPTFEKVDPRTFRFKLLQKDVLFHAAVGSITVIPKHKWEGEYKAGRYMAALGVQTKPEDVVSSGPFRIKSFAAAERLVIERNPYYWKVDSAGNRLPYLDKVVYVIVPDYNVVFLKFREGETDMLDVRPEHYDLLKREEAKADYAIIDVGPSFNTNYLMFNLDQGKDKDGKPFVNPAKLAWFSNKNFRKAISHAIDREGMVRTVLHGRGQPLWALNSPANKKWYNEKVIQYPYDLKKTEEMLRAEGFTRKEDGLFDPAGNKVEFSVMTNSENATRVALINVIKDDLAKIGIQVSVRPVPFNDVVTSLNDTRNFEGLVLGWSTGIPPDPAMSKNILQSSGRSHNWWPQQKTPATPWEARIDELLLKSLELFDNAERKKLTDEIYAILSDELPQINLVVSNAYGAARRNVGNFRPVPIRNSQPYWNLDVLYFKSPKKS